ncbi:MAG: hypothetical protein AB1641_29500 [Thermodesulfobacteriota bacterium]
MPVEGVKQEVQGWVNHLNFASGLARCQALLEAGWQKKQGRTALPWKFDKLRF